MERLKNEAEKRLHELEAELEKLRARTPPVHIPQIEWRDVQAAIAGLQPIAQGGQACVYVSNMKLPNRDLEIPVAIKVYKQDDVFVPLASFQAEVLMIGFIACVRIGSMYDISFPDYDSFHSRQIDAFGRLRHERIVPVLGFGSTSDNKSLCVVFEPMR